MCVVALVNVCLFVLLCGFISLGINCCYDSQAVLILGPFWSMKIFGEFSALVCIPSVLFFETHYTKLLFVYVESQLSN